MKSRCYSERNPAYQRYGGRGIIMAERWLNYASFREDMIHGYKPGLSIDRINNNGNYEPGNVRWANDKTQARNTRRTIMGEMNGERKPLIEWAEKAGLPYQRVKQRIQKLGWNLQEALSPLRWHQPI